MGIISAFLTRYIWWVKGIALLILVIALWGAWHSFTGHYKAIGRAEVQVQFDAFKDAATKAVNAQVAENAANRKRADNEQAGIKLHYEQKIAELNLDRNKVKKELQDALPRIKSLLSDVGVYQNNSNIKRMSKDEVATQLSAKEPRDCNRTVAILTAAGQSCALDYDALYDSWIAEMKAVNPP